MIYFLNIYLIIFREEKGGRKRAEKHQCVVASSHALSWGPGQQPMLVP